MTYHKCRNCNKGFQSERGLSSHFQHKNLCKAIHYSIACQIDYKNDPIDKTKIDKLTEASTLTPLKALSYEDVNSNLTCINEEQSINLDDEPKDESLIESSKPEWNECRIKKNEEEENGINCTLFNEEENNIFSFHNDERVESNLLGLMVEIGAPNYAYKKIMNWAKDAFCTNYQFNPKATNYKSQIKAIENHSNLGDLRPKMKRVTLPPDNLTLDVTCYNFTTMLASLLNDKNLNAMSNLVVNSHDPFTKYVSPNGKLGEVNSGYWYHQAYTNVIKDPCNDFLLPIIFAMDKTTISTNAHLHVFVILFTTTIFKRSIRNQAHAWRPLGYIPIDRNYYSTSQWEDMTAELKSF